MYNEGMLMPLFVLIASFVPNFVWLALYLREDPNPEPKPLLTLAFFLGMCATGIALGIEYVVLQAAHVMTGLGVTVIYNAPWYMFLGVALVEEGVKFLLVRFVIARSPAFDEPIDAMMYMIVTALGFAFVENVLIIGNALLPTDASVADVLRTVMFRFIGANFLHLMASGMVGYFWARGILARSRVKFIFLGLGSAVLIHGTFNTILMHWGGAAYVASLALLFAFGLIFLRDLELLKQLSRSVSLTVYYPDKKRA